MPPATGAIQARSVRPLAITNCRACKGTTVFTLSRLKGGNLLLALLEPHATGAEIDKRDALSIDIANRTVVQVAAQQTASLFFHNILLNFVAGTAQPLPLAET